MVYGKRILLLVLSGLLASALVAGEGPTPEELVRKLGADDFDVRQVAAEKLEAMGEAARSALVKARRSEVLEIRATVERLLRRLREAHLLLQVMDEDGRPCPKLPLTGGLRAFGQSSSYQQQQLLLARAARAGRESMETDEEGWVRLESHQAGPHTLHLSMGNPSGGANWNRPAWQPISLNLRSGENRAYFVHPHGATIKGRVVSVKTGEPIADAEVMVRRDDGASLQTVLRNWPAGNGRLPVSLGSSDGKGLFTIERVGTASLRVFARHTDYAPVVGPALIAAESREYTLDEPIRLVSKDEAWGRIRVQVLDGDGKPAKGAKASLRVTEVCDPVDEPETDAMGGPWAAWQRRFQHRQPVVLNADDDGWIETERMAPGTYRLITQLGDLSQGQQGTGPSRVDYEEIQVKAGETVSIPGRKAAKNGSLSCRVKGDEQNLNRQPMRVFALRLDDPDVKAWLAQPNAMQPWILNMLLSNDRNAQYVHGVNQEVELRNLLPGHYALGFQSMRDNRIGWVFGVEVKADERTTVPELDLAETAGPAADRKPQMVSGVLLGENGKRIEGNANWTLKSRNASTGSNSGANFRIDIRQNGVADTLTFTVSGYRPFTVDLSKPIPNPNNMVIQLLPQEYGSVVVLVHDPDGKALEDVRVMPISARQKTPSPERTIETGFEGRAKLDGLASGPRQITAVLEGYYLPEPAKVEVEAGQTKEWTVTLRPGVAVSGRVLLPAGLDSRKVLVWIARSQASSGYGYPQTCWRSTNVDEQGRFTFSGVEPGTVSLRAQAPGLLSEEREVVAGEGQSVKLQLSKPVNLQVDLGASGRSGMLSLLKSGAWNPLEYMYAFASGSNTPTDANGRALIGNVAPGTYDLIFTPTQSNPLTGRQSAFHRVAAGVKVGGGKAPEPLKVSWQPGTSAVKFRIEQPEGVRGRFQSNQRVLVFEGTKACAFVQVSSIINAGIARKPWIVKGTPPEGFSIANEAPGFELSGLPAGEYRLHVLDNPWYRRGSVAGSRNDPLLLKTIVLKEGETIDMGTIDMKRPETPAEDVDDEDLETGEDEPLQR